jgi:nucleotidyltransferase/DNA polymerase involved in DNA repair
VDLLQRLLGEHGPVLWRKANGIDDSPVVAWHERKSISTERTFERDTIDVVKLRGTAHRHGREPRLPTAQGRASSPAASP